jgi:hypothetical protein
MPLPTLVLTQQGDTKRHILRCIEDTNISNVVCECTSFEIHMFPMQPIEVVCSACGEAYSLTDLTTMSYSLNGAVIL